MIQVFVKPGAQDVGYRLGEVPSPSLILRINRVSHDAKGGLSAVRWYL